MAKEASTGVLCGSPIRGDRICELPTGHQGEHLYVKGSPPEGIQFDQQKEAG